MKIRVLLITLLLSCTAFAQKFFHQNDKFSCYDFGVICGLGQIRGDHNGPSQSLESWDFCPNFGLVVRKNFNYDYYVNPWHRRFDKKVAFRLGLMNFRPQTSAVYNKNVKTLTTNLTEVQFLAEYNFIKLNTSRDVKYDGYVLTPYLGGGLSLGMFNVKNAFTLENQYDNLQFAPSIMALAGGKAAIFSGVTFFLEVAFALSLSDDLDGFTDGRSGPDQYYYLNFGLSFNIGEMRD